VKRLLFPFLISAATAQIPAFPGAEGYGGYANGGRGGDVYVVTNLNASGTGSFVNGLSNVPAAGRTIVFAVSGYIRLPSGSGGTRMTASKVTIAGHTAPGDGIGFYNNGFRISGDDVILRHLRFRVGKNGSPGDCLNLDSGSIRSMLDHLSIQFSTDENFSSFGSPPEDLTMQYSLNAWGLNPHSAGGLWDQSHATAHHNLWAHNHTRNPKARPNGLLEWVNNVTFDWNIGFIMGDSQTPAPWKANVIGNYFLSPPGNLRSRALEKALVDRNGNPNFSVHLSNNRHDNDGDGLLNGTDKGYAIVGGSEFTPGDPAGANRYVKSLVPFSNAGSIPVSTDDPVLAFKKVASKAGALRLDLDPAKPLRDEVDTRLIQNLLTQARNHITRESDLAGISNAGLGTLNSSAAPQDSDLDGMPDFYEIALGWNPAVQDHNSALPQSGGLLTGTTFMPAGTVAGYTRLEEYLHYKAIPHGTVAKNTVDAPTSVQVDLRKFTAGFTAAPTFAVSNLTGGSVALGGPGNAIATFTPALNHVGRARFDFTVTDGAGHSWTQTCALVVTNAGLPRDLKWQGGIASNLWDGATANWLRNGEPTTFSFGDRVAFDDSGSRTPAINVSGTHAPGTVDFDATGNYSITGSGALTSSGPLTKRGSGNLTVSNTGPNSFGSVTLESGTLTIGNANALGTAPLRLEGGTWNIGANSPTNPITAAGPATITGGSGGGLTGIGAITGNAPLTIQQTNVFDLRGDLSGYSGTLTFTGNSPIRLNGSIGSATTAFNLLGATTLNKRSGAATITLGSLSGSAGTTLSGATGNTSATTYVIGGLGTSTTFAGNIANGGGTTGISKTGGGVLTLGGTGSYTGPTALNQGRLLIDGTLGNTAVAAAAGTLLGGDGSIAGPVTMNAGSFLSPGTLSFTGATLTLGGGLSLNGSTMYCDMSSTTAGANDQVVMNGGTLALSGALNFQFLLLEGTLAAGTYDLITGASNSTASNVTLNHNLPTGTRQTFTLGRSAAGSNPSKIWLTVTGDPATLTWTGATSATWDTATANNWTGATPNTFGIQDAVVFNDSSAIRSITLAGTLAPRSVVVNTAAGYTFGGTGISGGGSLTKTGNGPLTLSNTAASTFNGGTFLQGGSIVLTNSTANSGGLGSGPVTFGGGTLTMAGYNGSNSVEFAPMPNALIVPTGATGTLQLTQRAPKPGSANVFPALNGPLSGGGTLNLAIKFLRGDVLGDWSAFSGVLNVVPGDADGGDFRFGTSYSWPGMPAATVNLGNQMGAYYVGISNSGAGTTVEFGELSGTASSRLYGGSTGGRNFAYRIGGKTPPGGEVVFAGSIGEQHGSVTTSYTKTGAGTWTLSGSGAWNGGTTVEQGTLKISGSFTCLSATGVQPGATLAMAGGSLATDSVSLPAGANLSGHGTLAADLNADGSLDGRGFTSGTPGTLVIDGNAFFGSSSLTRLRGGTTSDLVTVRGDLALGGTVQVSLAPGTGFGRYPLITYGGTLDGTAILTGIPAGTTAHLSTTTPGQLVLVIDDSDEDGLPDSWEMANFGTLDPTAAGDRDGDGTSNLAEFRLGLNPADGTSAFRATITGRTLTWPSAPGVVFTIRRSLDLQGTWPSIGTVTAGPGATATFTDPHTLDRAFYRVEFTP
jgi:autotransporter-associated beta strand protein